MKEIIIFGFQKASIYNFYFSLNKYKYVKNKVTLFNNKNISNNNLRKILYERKKINFLNKNKFINKIIITGTSESYFEINLWNFFKENNINYLVFVDSRVNIKKRFINAKQFPDKILVQDKITKKLILKNFKNKIKNDNIINIGNLFHQYLYTNKKFFIAKKNNIMFMTSYKGIDKELPIFLKIVENYKKSNKSIYLCLHPRENKKKWDIKKIRTYKHIKIIQNNFLDKIKYAGIVFGFDTMGLMDAYFLDKDVYYLKSSKVCNSLMIKKFQNLKMNYFKLKNDKLFLSNNIKFKTRPYSINTLKFLNNN